jgi:peptidoglycan/LPS O-acetylase OafA/YrhL
VALPLLVTNNQKHVSVPVPSEGGKSRLKVLDVFRALAILGVMVHHYLPRWAPPGNAENLYGYRNVYPEWLNVGSLGVQFFFMISGFVIFMTLERCGHLFEFWVRRLTRLYPAYLVCMAMTFVLVNAIGPAQFATQLTDIPANLFFLSSYVPGGKFIEPAYWSLVVELQFYFLISMIFAVAGQRICIGWAFFCAAGSILWCVGAIEGLHPIRSIANHFFLINYLPQFTLGMFFYRRHSGKTDGSVSLLVAAICSYLVVGVQFPVSFHLAHIAMVIAFVLFLVGKLDWLGVRPLLFVGAVSYPLYLIHQYVGVSLIGQLTSRVHLPDLMAAVTAGGICVVIAYLVLRFVEEPCKRGILAIVLPKLSAWQVRNPRFAFGSI